MITAHASVASAVDAMRHGAFDYIEKPFDVESLERLVARAIQHGRLLDRVCVPRCGGTEPPAMIGMSAAMQALRARIFQVARTAETVLITGESGTGKELVARAVHAASERAAAPWVSLNCPVLSAHLMESELFGHERGAFTGADSPRTGRFELADGGTILLDEISEIDLGLQAKLLRVLQEHVREGRFEPNARCRRSHFGHDQSQSAARSGGRPIPRRFVLSAGRRAADHSPAARTARRCSRARTAFSLAGGRTAETRAVCIAERRDRLAHALSLARKCPRVGEHHHAHSVLNLGEPIAADELRGWLLNAPEHSLGAGPSFQVAADDVKAGLNLDGMERKLIESAWNDSAAIARRRPKRSASASAPYREN